MSETKITTVSDVQQMDESMNEMSEQLNDKSVLGINILTEYELIEIMSYLSITERICLSQVCLQWKTIIDQSFKSVSVLNQKSIFGTNFDKRISELGFSLIVKKCCNVRHIAMKDVLINERDEDSNGFILETIANNCHLLETIDFGDIWLEDWDQSFVLFAEYFTQMKKIISENMTQNAINCIIDSQNIECIDISYNAVISALDLRRIGPKVRELHLIRSDVIFNKRIARDLCAGNGIQINSLSIDIMESGVLRIICSQMKELVSFKLSLYNNVNNDFNQFNELQNLKSLSVDVKNTHFGNCEFRALMRALRRVQLIELQIILTTYYNMCITDDSMHELSINCLMLEKLLIRNAISLTSAGMHYISRLNRLKAIDLMGCECIDDGIEIVIICCPLLRSLNLHNCSEVSVSTVDSFISKAKSNPNDKFYLDVIDTQVEEDFDREIPSNMKIDYRFEDCVYNCPHGFAYNLDIFVFDYDSDDDNNSDIHSV